MKTNVLKIELTADQMYFTIIGDKNDMSLLLAEIKPYDDAQYMISKLCIPIAHIPDISEDISKDIYVVDNHMEQIQCSILCDCDSKEEKRAYALMRAEKEQNICALKYLYIDAKNDCEPESLIIDEIKKIFSKSDIVDSIVKSIRLVDIISNDGDTLIYLSRYSYNKRK